MSALWIDELQRNYQEYKESEERKAKESALDAETIDILDVFLQDHFREIQRAYPERTVLKVKVTYKYTDCGENGFEWALTYTTTERNIITLPYDYESMKKAVKQVKSYSDGRITGRHLKYWHEDNEYFLFKLTLV